jgi:uncharacterized membrane protein (DUF2068 family)
MVADPKFIKRRAPALYVIIASKFFKGALFITLAIVVYALSDNDLPAEYQQWLHILHLNPEKRFWTDLAVKVGNLTEAKVVWVAVGTLIYSLFALVEGVGLLFRAGWAGWLSIGESAFFIPIEVFDLIHRPSWVVLGILALNIFIVWYLYQNRGWLFRHHGAHPDTAPDSLSPPERGEGRGKGI